MPFPTANALGQYGMLAFLAYAGSTSGSKLVAALQTDVGPRLFLLGLIITGFAALVLRIVGPRWGGLSGATLAHTKSAAFRAHSSAPRTKSSQPSACDSYLPQFTRQLSKALFGHFSFTLSHMAKQVS